MVKYKTSIRGNESEFNTIFSTICAGFSVWNNKKSTNLPLFFPGPPLPIQNITEVGIDFSIDTPFCLWCKLI